MKKIVLIVLLSAFFVGCAEVKQARLAHEAQEKVFWKKDGTNYRTAKIDFNACESKVDVQEDAKEYEEKRQKALIESCMELNGYEMSAYVY